MQHHASPGALAPASTSVTARLMPLATEDTPSVDALASLLKASGDSLRLQILSVLRSDSLGVLEMCSILDTRQSALSHHLKVLFNAGLLASRREGNAIFYRRAFLNSDDPLHALKSHIYDSVDLLQPDRATEARLLQVRKEREQQSLDFFSKCADKFQQNQDLVADARQYAGSLQELLDGSGLPATSIVMEVGPGEGKLLPLLSRSFAKVIALDNSAQMLKLARATAREAQLSNVRFVAGDTARAAELGLKADLIIFSMVLHHIASPAEAFAQCASLLPPGGMLLVVDLCRHHQDWVRDSCGDLWLGFEADELCNWARQAGFNSGQHLLQGLRNGFQIQMRVFQLVSDT
jgi:ubiquinone/menaquinone biosynthesis C-methylase UbiE/DNA-binding transcriptional ArsR family regulator